MRLRSSQVYPLYMQCLSLWAIRFTTWALIKPHGQELVRGQFHSGPVVGYWSVRKIQLAFTKSGGARNWIPPFRQSFLNLLVLMMMVVVDIIILMMMVVGDFMVVPLLVMILGWVFRFASGNGMHCKAFLHCKVHVTILAILEILLRPTLPLF